MARPKGDASATEARKSLILAAAFEVFSNKGFRGGSLSQVSELVGISEAGILHHFKNKGSLLIAVLEYRDRLSKEVTHITAEMEGLDFVSSWFELMKFNISHPGIVELYCIVSAESTNPDHPANQFFRDRYVEVIQVAASAFTKLQSQGYLRENLDPFDAARALIALSDGLQVQWLLNKDWDMIREHKNFFMSTLSDAGIAATKI